MSAGRGSGLCVCVIQDYYVYGLVVARGGLEAGGA